MNTLDCIPIPFIWDGVASELYGMTIGFSSTDYNFVPSGSSVTMQTDRATNSIETFILNEANDQVLEFPVEIFCDSTDVFKQAEVKRWLYGKSGYKKLQICIENHNTFYYNCKLIPSTDVVFSSPNGFQFTVVCDSPGAWEFPRVVLYHFPQGSYHNFIFNNMSGDPDYMRPTVEFKTMINSTSFAIRNNSDLDGNGKPREFSFNNIQGGETIEVDNKNKIMTSSTGLYRLDNFNKKFLRLKHGVNELTAIGQCEYLKITYQNFRRLGGAIY